MYSDEIRTAIMHDLLRALGVGSPPQSYGGIVQQDLETIVRRQRLTEPDGTAAQYEAVVRVQVFRIPRSD